MSATEWKPGDVAMAEARGSSFMVARHAGGESDYWSALNGVWPNDNADEYEFRRLVVLDPESAEDVRRLHDAVMHVADEAVRTRDKLTYGDTQTALRELANPTPPKPDEPKGLGAVVEGRDGDRWVRSRDRWLHQIHGFGWTWDQVPAVRVLSEGVPE